MRISQLAKSAKSIKQFVRLSHFGKYRNVHIFIFHMTYCGLSHFLSVNQLQFIRGATNA